MNQPHARNLTALAALAILFGVGSARSNDQDPAEVAKPTATQTAPDDAGKSTAQQAIEDLRKKREANQFIEPMRRPLDRKPRASIPPLHTGLDSTVLGIAPGGEQPTLRREGEFVIARRGRLLREPNSSYMIFQFDADGQQSPDPPMVVLPCRLLENMERLVHHHADQVLFNITGQVFVYRGLNYLLPTMFTLTVDKGNLQR